MTTSKFKVGDKVVLNDKGLEALFGDLIGISHMKTKVLIITEVLEEIILSDDKSCNFSTHVYSVDDPEINIYILYSECFDIAPKVLLV